MAHIFGFRIWTGSVHSFRMRIYLHRSSTQQSDVKVLVQLSPIVPDSKLHARIICVVVDARRLQVHALLLLFFCADSDFRAGSENAGVVASTTNSGDPTLVQNRCSSSNPSLHTRTYICQTRVLNPLICLILDPTSTSGDIRQNLQAPDFGLGALRLASARVGAMMQAKGF